MGTELYRPPPKRGDELKDAIEMLRLARAELIRSRTLFILGVAMLGLGLVMAVASVMR